MLPSTWFELREIQLYRHHREMRLYRSRTTENRHVVLRVLNLPTSVFLIRRPQERDYLDTRLLGVQVSSLCTISFSRTPSLADVSFLSFQGKREEKTDSVCSLLVPGFAGSVALTTLAKLSPRSPSPGRFLRNCLVYVSLSFYLSVSLYPGLCN